MIIFTHIPRTGGTTLQGIAARQYRQEEILRLYGDAIENPAWALRMPTVNELAELKLVSGHNAFGLHGHIEYVYGGYESIDYLTILRDPIERAISVYEYIKRAKGHHLHQASQGLPLKEFVVCGITTELDNGMTRQISGTCGELPQAPWPDAPVPVGAMTRAHIEQAKAHLRDDYAVVGITERFEETVSLCQRKFGWTVDGYQSRNVSRNRRERWRFSADTMEVLEEHNRLDLELYEFGLQLFEAAVAG